uniref:DUF1275 domain protein n=1 Tax=Pyrodinium bahamense TaxID=73915 RepID=A0A7S0AMI7_9DINO|mmetsp:Transcript_37635/g.104756  ORF Transcript_37635/g.104756 Transcript_37635/m.104756 type:complete len:242 (+) Transcript_37635:66-791(+)|eukprot:CAMPEP_0179087160 /NCGR_PEP_ID=MMETSP0796-20121207/39586_1 /TAXON_ID=73915 /ORGANISM="Pyrodinium bahamense, Strain pbaha01" /LENGTH=241 /DNA_ID=CAMNT_0020784661 /DNA_START=66 /DNA_END=791 /DNA_ORIENTATION=+
MASKDAAPAPKPAPIPLDKRADYSRICIAGGLITALSGMVNGIALVELGSPPGYTSGTTMNMGRMLGVDSKKFFALWLTYISGGFVAGYGNYDGDAFVEGRYSPALLCSAMLLALGAVMKKSNAFLALQLMSFSQGLQNAITSKFSSVPIRSTHTAGGMTDAGLVLGQYFRALSEGRAAPALRKTLLTLCTVLSFAVGGFGSRFAQKWFGIQGAFIPAALVAVMAVASPMAALPDSKKEEP